MRHPYEAIEDLPNLKVPHYHFSEEIGKDLPRMHHFWCCDIFFAFADLSHDPEISDMLVRQQAEIIVVTPSTRRVAFNICYR